MDARAVISTGMVLGKKFVGEKSYQSKRFLWVDPNANALCWSKGTTKNEDKYKFMPLEEAIAVLPGIPTKFNPSDTKDGMIIGLTIYHEDRKAFKGGVDLRFQDAMTRSIWYQGINSLMPSVERLSLHQPLHATDSVVCPGSPKGLETEFGGGTDVHGGSTLMQCHLVTLLLELSSRRVWELTKKYILCVCVCAHLALVACIAWLICYYICSRRRSIIMGYRETP